MFLKDHLVLFPETVGSDRSDLIIAFSGHCTECEARFITVAVDASIKKMVMH